jgi:phosphopantetheine--protein transferase-like protein
MIAGLGVDILSLKRAHQFLKEHQRSREFFNLFSRDEIQDIHEIPEWTPLLWAKYFTAKEAFLKALSLNVFQWDDITIKMKGDARFEAYSATLPNRFSQSIGCYFIEEEYVGAQMIIYNE